MRRSNLVDSFRFAFAGLWYALRSQRNLRIQAAIAGAVIAGGIWVGLSPIQWAVLALTSGFVLVSELLNTALEAVVDLASPDYHSLAKIAKDVTAGAVLLAAIFAIIVGLLVLGPPLWERLMGAP